MQMQKNKNIKLESKVNSTSSESKEFLNDKFLPHKKWEKNHEEDSFYPITNITIKKPSEIDVDEFTDEDESEMLAYIWGNHLDGIEQSKETAFDLFIKQKEMQSRRDSLVQNAEIDNTEIDNFVTLNKWKKGSKKREKAKNIKPKNVERKRSRRRKIFTVLLDILIIVVCLIGAYFSIKEFYLAINRTLQKEGEQPIATISFKHNTAQRKISDRVLWDRLKQESPIYNGDIIRTSTLSEATVTFLDGNEINLYDQTLAQVFFDEKMGTSIDFTGGAISLNSDNSDTGMTLTSGDTRVTMARGTNLTATMDPVTSASAARSGISSLNVQVTSGSADFTVGNERSRSTPQTVSLTEGTSIEVLPNGSIEEPIVTVFSPENNTRYLNQSSEKFPVKFMWTENIEEPQDLQLQLSSKNNFSEIEQSVNITGLNETTLNIEDGNWYWQIIDETDWPIAEGKLKVLTAIAPEPIIPLDNDVFNYRTKLPSVRFVWTDDEIANDWLFEVSDNPEMKNPIILQRTSQPSSIVSDLTQGTWYWRVTPSYAPSIITEEKYDSHVYSFSIQQKGDLESAELLFPIENELIDLNNVQNFSWVLDREAASYTIIISDNKELENPLVNKIVYTNYLALTEDVARLKPGKWYWSVTKTDSEGNTSQKTDVKSFFVLDGKPVHSLVSPENEIVVTESKSNYFDFVWESNIPYETKVQVSKNKDFNVLLHEISTNEKKLEGISIPVGEWYWRIVTENTEDGIYYVSEPNRIYVDFELDKPVIRAPVENYKLVLEPNTPSLFISWQPVKDADYYEFLLYNKNNYRNPVYKDAYLDETSIRLNMKNRERGEYFYTVSAVSNSTASGSKVKSNVTRRDFSTRDLNYIKLEYPQQNYTIDGLSALLEPIYVEWSCDEKLAETEFVLTKDNEVFLEIENPDKKINLPQLQSGDWSWIVKGKNNDGYEVSAQRPYTIHVEEIPLLPAPSNSLPKNNTILDMNYFIENSSIYFDWDAVTDADKYTFVLKDEKNNILVKKEFTSTTDYNFEQIELLDRGIFIWEVEAERQLPEYVQRGTVLSQKIIVDLPEMQKAENKTSGELYGN